MMYKVIGVDQKVYGPASGDQLRQWLRDGRLNLGSLVQADGATDWKPLSAFPELAPPPAYTPPPAPMPQTSDGMATASLVFGIAANLCCCFGIIFAIIGLVLSLIALHRLEPYPHHGSRGVAWAGLILSIAALVWHCFVPFFFGFPGGWWMHHRHWRYL